MNKERIADSAAAAGWALWGLSLTTVNELLTALSLLAATFASIAAGIYYLVKILRRKP
jgi:hypothetical protein